jgi:predicted nucleic-acid-binding Zn-ribbon protein
MPDDNGKLSPEEKKKITDWLQKRWKESPKCPISGDDDWAIGDHAITPVIMGKQGGIFGDVGYPHIMLICKTCGYTILFNAVMMGIFPPRMDSNAAK